MNFKKLYSNSQLMLGTMRISHLSDDNAEKLFDKAISLGIRLFDFADIYGDGLSEEIFGRYLNNHKNIRKDIIIQSKCGICDGYYDLSKDYIINSTVEIIKRLNCDYLDILLLHRPDALVDFDEVNEAFKYLHKKGLVKHFGVSNFNASQLRLMKKHVKFPIIANQLQFNMYHSFLVDEGLFVNMEEKYALAHSSGTLEYCQEKNINVQAWSILMASWDDGIFVDNPKFPKLNEVLEKYANKYNVTKAAIVVAWICTHPAQIKPICGTTNPTHLEELIKGINIKLDRKEWYDIYLTSKDDKFLP